MASRFTQVATLGAYGGLATAAGGAVADQPIDGALVVLGLGLVAWPLAYATTRRRTRSGEVDAPRRSGRAEATSPARTRAPESSR